MINGLIIILFVGMFVGSYLVAKAGSNFGRKIFWSSAIICAAILFLTGCGNENKIPPPTPKVEEKTPEQTRLSTNQPSYDMLQQFFLTLNQNVTMQQIEDIILKNKIPHTSWSSSDHSITYRIAYRQSDALRLHGTSGDYLDITFNDGDKKFENGIITITKVLQTHIFLPCRL